MGPPSGPLETTAGRHTSPNWGGEPDAAEGREACPVTYLDSAPGGLSGGQKLFESWGWIAYNMHGSHERNSSELRRDDLIPLCKTEKRPKGV
ncbi:MAG TPA: hypothetical protein DCR97_06630 [Deltaproteobacteria bacterium]|nr:hypothetical protein [Deltaproteobacteria bacterium]